MGQAEQDRLIARFVDTYCKDWPYAVMLGARRKTLGPEEKATYAINFAAKVLHDIGMAQTAAGLIELYESANQEGTEK